MSISGLLISLVLIGISTLIVILPFVRRVRSQSSTTISKQQQYDRIQTYYERVLTNIRDLDEDFTTGKISESDYQEEREVWVHRGIRLLRVQDQLDAQGSLIDTQNAGASNIDDAIENAIKAYREGDAAIVEDMSQAEQTGTS